MPIHVPGVGPKNPLLAIVGEAPGADEERLGQPFVGPSGRLLNEMLVSCGISRQQCYITNVVKERPPQNDFSTLYKDKSRREPTDRLLTAISRLKHELGQVRPKLILAAGGEPLRALTGKMGIEKWRGTVIDTPVAPILGTYHPANILRVYANRTICELDLRKALRWVSGRMDVGDKSYNFTLDPGFEEVLARLKWLQETSDRGGGLSKRKGHPNNSDQGPSPLRLALDIETTGSHTRCLGLAWSPQDAISIPFTANPNRRGVSKASTTIKIPTGQCDIVNRWTLEEEYEILTAINEILLSPKIEKILQNHPFDSTILAKDFGLCINNLWMDTMLVQHSCYSEMPKSLDFLTSIYTDIGYYADYEPASDMSTWRYNCMDCIATYQVAEKLLKEAQELRVWDHYKSIVEPAMLALTRAQNRGIDIDPNRRGLLTHHFTKAIEEDRATAIRITDNPDFNPNSPLQVKELLKKLHIPIPIDRRTRKQTTNAKYLSPLSLRYPQHEKILNAISKHRSNVTIRSTFLTGKLNDRGRMETSYNIAGTVSGRLSSGKTIFGVGGNLQNIPKGAFRRMYIPPPGFLLIKADLSQAEVMVVAWDAPIPLLIDKYTNDPSFDIHLWNASENVFRKDPSTVTKDERDIAKAGVHGGNYGLGPRTASRMYHISYQDAKHSLEAYRSALPEIAQWWIKIQSQVNSTRRLRTPHGRQRIFLGRLDDELYRSAYSFVPQAVVADIIAQAFSVAEEVLLEVNGFPLLQVHDEIVFVVPKENLEKALPLVKILMEPSLIFPLVDIPLTIPCEISYGPNWFDQKK